MSAKSLGILLAITAVAVVAALLLSGEERHGIPARGQRVFPELKERINQVSEVTVATTTGAVTIARTGDAWLVKEKDDYRAAMDKVRSVVIGLAELTILEPKTKNPEHHAKLGLQDVTVEGSESTQVTLRDTDGAALASVLIGNRQPSRADSTRDEVYVRRSGEEQTWLAIGRLRPEKAPIGWIERQILDIDTQRVRQVRVTHPDGETVLLRKARSTNVDYTLADLPEKAELRSQFTLNNIVDTLAHLTVEDVLPRTDVDIEAHRPTTAVLETFDGLRLTVRTTKVNGKHLVTAAAAFEEGLVQAPPESIDEGAQPGAGGGAQAGTPAAPEPARLKSPDEVRQEVEALNRRLRDWVFAIPEVLAQSLTKRRGELIS